MTTPYFLLRVQGNKPGGGNVRSFEVRPKAALTEQARGAYLDCLLEGGAGGLDRDCGVRATGLCGPPSVGSGRGGRK